MRACVCRGEDEEVHEPAPLLAVQSEMLSLIRDEAMARNPLDALVGRHRVTPAVQPSTLTHRNGTAGTPTDRSKPGAHCAVYLNAVKSV